VRTPYHIDIIAHVVVWQGAKKWGICLQGF